MGKALELGAAEERRVSRPAIAVALVVLMVTLVISGLGFVAVQQGELWQLQEQSRATRVARQALIDVDVAVLNAMVRHDERSNVLGYGQAVAHLGARATSDFPANVSFDAEIQTGAQLVASLKDDWKHVMLELAAGDGPAAEHAYRSRMIEKKVAAFASAFEKQLSQLEHSYNEHQVLFQLGAAAVVLLQIVKMIVCVLAYMVASRAGRRETQARALAVTSANESREQVGKLFAMTDMLQSASDHQDANAVLRSTAADLIPAFGGALYIFNNSRDRLTLSTSWNRDAGDELPDTIGINQCWALKRGKPHLNPPDGQGLRCDHATGRDGCLEIPMLARGEILGLLQIFASGADAAKRLNEVASLGAVLADSMSLALANIALREKLRSQALRDPLTGLYNRRYMEDTLQRVVRLAERDQHDVSVIMIDLDHFKRLNDGYGHAKGDSVLRDAASLLINQIGETDIACRYGGEELIVVLPNCGIDKAAGMAERMRLGIESLSEPSGAQVSASFGVASIPNTSRGSRDLLAHADAALYQAKNEGRNRVVRAPIPKADHTAHTAPAPAHLDRLAA